MGDLGIAQCSNLKYTLRRRPNARATTVQLISRPLRWNQYMEVLVCIGSPPPRRLLVALTCSILMMLLASGIASAHGRTKGLIPNSCFWNVVASNTQNIVINGSTIGTYAAAILQNSCQSTSHAVDGDMHLTGGGCSKGRLQVSWTVNGTPQTGGDISTGSIGPSGCSTTELFWQSSTFTGAGATICVTTFAIYSGNPLSPNAHVCKSF